MRMLNGNVLVKVQKEGTTTKAGIILPTHTKPYKQVTVVKPDQDNTVKEGDEMYVPYNAGTMVEWEGDEYLVIHVREIILIL